MYSLIKELFSLLTPSQRKRFYTLQILVILMAIMELLGIASIGPFMALVADSQLIETNATLAYLYELSGLETANQFLFAVGVGVLTALTVASVISIITSWRLSLFAFSVGTEIADRLYTHYLNQNWLFHTSGSSAQLTKQIATESQRVTQQIIKPLTNLNARAVLALLISTAIILYNPLVALTGLAVFLTGYIIIYKLVRKRVVRNGKCISTANAQRFRLMNEGFGGIKDVLLLDRKEDFINQFNQTGKTLARAQGVNAALSETPRYFMELLAFGAMISLVLVLLIMHNGILSQVLPVLAVYALAGFKLLPALQQVYSSITQIKGNAAAFEAIKPDLIASRHAELDLASTRPRVKHGATLSSHAEQPPRHSELDSDSKTLHLQNITFTYPKANKPALNNISLSIPLNTTVGFVGESGSGKSTTIDLILGLIDPQEGQVLLDQTPITPANKRAWQNHIGFVPQSIFLSEGTIAENIAFGIKKEEINLEDVQKAVKLAHLEELVNSLPDELNTKVGERGVKLSGGQRQRIGIARALYNNASILVFDEATSALDGITEKIIMDAIHELSGQRTIILIAHRLKTVQQCNTIFLMEQGNLVDQGSYQELIERNESFKKMARFA